MSEKHSKKDKEEKKSEPKKDDKKTTEVKKDEKKLPDSKKDDKKSLHKGEKKEDAHKSDSLEGVDRKRPPPNKKSEPAKESVDGKAKVTAVLEEESSEEEEDVKVTRVGYVEQKTKAWKAVYCVLIGGSFYWSKSSTVRLPLGNCHRDRPSPRGFPRNRFSLRQDPDPKGAIDLKGKKLAFDVKGLKKEHVFAIQDKGENLFVGGLSSENELNQWKKGAFLLSFRLV